VRKVEVGQQYRKAGTSWKVWEVVDETVRHEGFRHLRLRDPRDPTNTKLVSERALANDKLYQLVTLP
jgi:hypothetical protein